jgi:hypothetical protein
MFEIVIIINSRYGKPNHFTIDIRIPTCYSYYHGRTCDYVDAWRACLCLSRRWNSRKQVGLQFSDRSETTQVGASDRFLHLQYTDMLSKDSDLCAHHYRLFHQ